MFRVIDLDSFAQNPDSQTIFTFAVGSERHGIPAAELFELLKLRVAQNAAGKGANRKTTTSKRPSNSDQADSPEFQAAGSPANDGAEESALSN